jgi:hypothetical protein
MEKITIGAVMHNEGEAVINSGASKNAPKDDNTETGPENVKNGVSSESVTLATELTTKKSTDREITDASTTIRIAILEEGVAAKAKELGVQTPENTASLNVKGEVALENLAVELPIPKIQASKGSVSSTHVQNEQIQEGVAAKPKDVVVKIPGKFFLLTYLF